jgi:hypothetical protein
MSAPNINHPTVAGAINDEEKNGEEDAVCTELRIGESV